MLKTIQAILSNYTTIQQDEITEDLVLVTDLGLSSFDLVAIISDFEDEFDIEIPDRDIRKLVMVKDIMEYIQAKG